MLKRNKCYLRVNRDLRVLKHEVGGTVYELELEYVFRRFDQTYHIRPHVADLGRKNEVVVAASKGDVQDTVSHKDVHIGLGALYDLHSKLHIQESQFSPILSEALLFPKDDSNVLFSYYDR